MELSPTQYRLATLPSAFAAACRDSRSDAELFERCRDALVRRFHSDQIWFVVAAQGGIVSSIGTADGRDRPDRSSFTRFTATTTSKGSPSRTCG